MSISFKRRIDTLEKRVDDYQVRLETEERRRKILEDWLLENFEFDVRRVELEKKSSRSPSSKKVKAPRPQQSPSPRKKLKLEQAAASENIDETDNPPEVISLMEDESEGDDRFQTQTDETVGFEETPLASTTEFQDSDPDYRNDSGSDESWKGEEDIPSPSRKINRLGRGRYTRTVKPKPILTGRPKEQIWEYYQTYFTEDDNSKKIFCKKCSKHITNPHTRYLRSHVSKCSSLPLSALGGDKPKRIRRSLQQIEAENSCPEVELPPPPPHYNPLGGGQRGPIWQLFRVITNPNPERPYQYQRCTVFCKKCGKKVFPKAYKMKAHLKACKADPNTSLVDLEGDSEAQAQNIEQESESEELLDDNVQNKSRSNNGSRGKRRHGGGAVKHEIWQHFKSVPIRNPTSKSSKVKAFCKYCGFRVSPQVQSLLAHYMTKCPKSKRTLAETKETETATAALLKLSQAEAEEEEEVQEEVTNEAPDGGSTFVTWTRATPTRIAQRIPLDKGPSSSQSQPVLFSLIEELGDSPVK